MSVAVESGHGLSVTELLDGGYELIQTANAYLKYRQEVIEAKQKQAR